MSTHRKKPAKKRILVDLPDENVSKLDRYAEETDVSRASVLRDAVAEYVIRREQAPATLQPLAGFGALKGYYQEALSYQDAIRKEWE